MADEIELAVAKLEAIASARPDMRAVVDVAVSAVKSAVAAENAALDRAEAAEALVEDVQPSMRILEKRAVKAEQALEDYAMHDTAERIEVLHEKQQVAKSAEVADEVEFEAAVERGVAKALQPEIDVLVGAHALTKSVHDGESLVMNRREGAFEIFNWEGDLINVAETRKDAVAMVRELVKIRKAAIRAQKELGVGAVKPEDDMPARRHEPQPGEEVSGSGRLDGRKLKKTRVTKRKVF